MAAQTYAIPKNLARVLIRNMRSDDEHFNAFVKQWLAEKTIKLYTHQRNTTILSFALLSKCDFDPLKEYDESWIINYVYTFPEYRRTGAAKEILKTLKLYNNASAFCCNIESEKLFVSAGYKNHGIQPGLGPIPLYRTT